MFGESDSESPRLSSPWEAFSTSPSPCPDLACSSSSSLSSSDIEAELARRLRCEVPRLVPEVEEGNVEYKLKLSPSPERLTRLVTQLKWRLLEGGGQALYEIGVGDAGQLVGLPRREMDGSLDALERMAGELGATVMVLREIIIPKGANGKSSEAGGSGDEEKGGATRYERLAAPTMLGIPQSGSMSGSGSSDEHEPFSLDLDGEDSPGPTSPRSLPSSWATPQTRLDDSRSNWSNKSKSPNNRRTKLAQKAEHKRVRREVKRGVNAAYSTSFGTSPTSSFGSSLPSALDTPKVLVSGIVPPVFGVPEVIIKAPATDDVPTVVVPFDSTIASAASATPDPDEVIIIEALVVRKLALEEAFLDFGGFSVLG